MQACSLIVDGALKTNNHQALALAMREALRGSAGDLVAGHATEAGAQGHTELGTGGPGHQPFQQICA
eukprot:Skav204197  [mRNA]  locus=scaffold3425:79172:81640:+ [translate_table: standard]